MNTEYKNCPAVLVGYLRYLDVVKKRSPNTVYSRYLDIKAFLLYLAQQKDDNPELPPGTKPDITGMDTAFIAAVSEAEIDAYFDSLSAAGISDQSIYRRRLGSLRMFYEYLIRNRDELGISIGINPVPVRLSPTQAASPCRRISRAEIDSVLDAIEGESAAREKAIILLVANTGASLHELAIAKYRNYDPKAMTLTVSGRTVTLNAETNRAIQIYISDYRQPIEEYLKDNTLFVSKRCLTRLTDRGIEKAIAKHFERAGIPGRARDLRYTAVLNMMESAKDDTERVLIAHRLGYSSPQILDLINRATKKPT